MHRVELLTRELGFANFQDAQFPGGHGGPPVEPPGRFVDDEEVGRDF
jgi:hypothetical protein